MEVDQENVAAPKPIIDHGDEMSEKKEKKTRVGKKTAEEYVVDAKLKTQSLSIEIEQLKEKADVKDQKKALSKLRNQRSAQQCRLNGCQKIINDKKEQAELADKLEAICQYLEEMKQDVQTRKCIEKLNTVGKKRGRPNAKLTPLRFCLGLKKRI